jgi:hypothetical protein
MVQQPVARVLQKFINLHRTQLQSYLFIYFILYIYIYYIVLVRITPEDGLRMGRNMSCG